jgi:hypothetical protein
MQTFIVDCLLSRRGGLTALWQNAPPRKFFFCTTDAGMSMKKKGRDEAGLKHNQPKNSQKNTRCTTHTTAPKLNPATPTDSYSQDHKREKFPRLAEWKPIIEFLGFLILLAYAAVTACSWYEMRKANRLNAISTGLAEKSLAANVKAMHLEQRAWIVPQFVGPVEKIGSPVGYSIGFINNGKTPATSVSVDIVATFLSIGQHLNLTGYNNQPHFSAKVGTEFPGPSQESPMTLDVMGTYAGETAEHTIVTTPEVRKAIQDGKINMFIFGRLTFNDVFGDSHWMQFCMRFGCTLSPPEIAADAFSCAAYNSVDTESNQINP